MQGFIVYSLMKFKLLESAETCSCNLQLLHQSCALTDYSLLLCSLEHNGMTHFLKKIEPVIMILINSIK
jgi:hypothetical protein